MKLLFSQKDETISNNKRPIFWHLKFLFQVNVFVECIKHNLIYFELKKNIFIFNFYFFIFGHISNSLEFWYILAKKMDPISEKTAVDMDFSFMGCFCTIFRFKFRQIPLQ